MGPPPTQGDPLPGSGGKGRVGRGFKEWKGAGVRMYMASA